MNRATVGFLFLSALGCLPIAAPRAAAADEAARPAPPGREHVLHLAPDAFTGRGPLGSLGLTQCAIKLADGVDRSILLVSPGMAAVGFRDLAFTLPAHAQAYDFGVGTMELSVRIPGSDVGDRLRTLQTTRIDVSVAGSKIVLTAVFESGGPEFIGEYRTRTALGGEGPRVHFLDIQADRLMVTATFPLSARGLLLEIGAVDVGVAFDFSVTAFGSIGIVVEDTPIKEYITGGVGERLRAFFNAEEYRGPLARALGLYLLNNPSFSGLLVHRLELTEAADGGLDIKALTR